MIQKMWRTLIRVVDIKETETQPLIGFVLCSWISDETVYLPITAFPLELRSIVQIGERFYVKATTGAERVEDLIFEDFEYRGRLQC